MGRDCHCYVIVTVNADVIALFRFEKSDSCYVTFDDFEEKLAFLAFSSAAHQKKREPKALFFFAKTN